MKAASPSDRPGGITLLALWYLFLVVPAALPLETLLQAPTDGAGRRLLLSVTAVAMSAVIGGLLALTAWGLWRMRAWARAPAILVALLHLPVFPVGTVIGLAALWYLSIHFPRDPASLLTDVPRSTRGSWLAAAGASLMAADDRPDGVTILALWYLVLAVGALFGACAAMLPVGVISVAGDLEPGGRIVLSLLAGLGLSVTVLFATVTGIAAWGLWRTREWARILVMVLALLHLPFFPVGTAIGVATLWYLSSHPDAIGAFGGDRPA